MPEGDPIRAWLHVLRQVAGDNPLPGPIRINVGITRRGAAALENSLRRDIVRAEAVDRLGAPTRRIVLDGVMFEWRAAGRRSDTPGARVAGDPRFSIEVWSDDGNRILEELARARNLSVARAAYDEALQIRPKAYVMLCDRARVIAKRPPPT